MNLVEFYQNLLAIGIELWVDGDKLCYEAPEDVLTPELLAEIKQYKEEFIYLLQKSTDTVKTDPLSHRQKALWFLYQLAPDSAAYNVAYASRIVSNVDIAVLRQAVQALLERHPVLRTTYTAQHGEPVQRIQENLEVCFSVLEVVNWSDNDFDNWLISESDRPFDLSNGPVLRFNLLIKNTLTDVSVVKEVILLMTAHHIVVDFWSLELLVNELRMFYEAFKRGQQVALASQNQQYKDYVRWENQMLASQLGEQLWNYWRDQLAGELPILNLPTDRPRPPVQTYEGASYSFVLEEKLAHKLSKLALAEGITLYTLLLAAFQVLLLRYTNQEDILIGSPMAGRSLTEFEKIVGYFANPVILRADLSGNPTFRELLCRVRSCVLGALEHQDYPFPLLVEQLQPLRDPSRSPLYQVAFVWDRSHQNEGQVSLMDSDGLIVESITPKSKGAPFDLVLTIFDITGPLKGIWKYNTDLFEADTIERMAGHFQTLLTGIVANPQKPISQLPLLSEVEQQQLLVLWNQTSVEYPQDKCIHHLFEEQAHYTPEAVAVVYEDQQLTYDELNRRANQLAHYLRSLGVGREVLVGICVERSVEMVVGLLGILKAGGAYVPLDPTYPTERKRFMLEDAAVSVLLTQQLLVDTLPEHRAQLVCLDSDWWLICQSQQNNPITDVQAHNLAYVIYTSGSTGRPKGVEVAHTGLLNLVFWHQRTFEITSLDKATQLAGTAFDAAVWELWPYLTAGASVHLVTSEILYSSLHLRDWLISNQITLSFLPTPIAENLLSLEWNQCLALRGMLTGGDLLHHYPSALIPFPVVNNYGPSENTVVTTSGLVVSNGQQSLSSPTIGRPIANTQVYILDSHLQPVPIGVPGEIHIGGAGLARGYLNRPELTMEKFIPNPFSLELGARLYKTGDLARYLPDGNIEYIGRSDHQVKLRGFRIELGEIEALLSQHPSVHSVVVTSRVEETTGTQRLVAYIVPQLATSPTVNEFRQFLKTKLPDYMVPSAIVILDSLPLTPNGKVDRRVLPTPELQSNLDLYVAPRTPIEEMLTQIWASVLKVELVGIHDNFFELGGDSILSIQIIARANQLGIVLSPKQLFMHQTISELAAVAGTTRAIVAEQGLVSGASPLTPIQHWFFEQNLAQPHHFNQSLLLVVPPEWKAEQLEQVVQYLLLHHDALRLRFVKSESDWQQIHGVVADQTAMCWFDLSTLPATEQTTAMETMATQLQASLNLSKDLVRVAFVRLGEDQPSRLLIVIHHLVVDGISWRILLADLQTLYQQLSQGKAQELPAKTTSFKEWAQRLAEYAQSALLKSELADWLDLDYREVSPIPVDYVGGVNTVASTVKVSVSLNEAQTRALLLDVPKAYNTQIQDVLLTALGLVLGRWTSSQRVLLNLEGHGREEIVADVDLTRTVGWFTTIFPLVVELGVTQNLGETLKLVKEQLRAIPNKGIGYGLLRYLSQDPEIATKLQALPQAQISFNYLGQFDQALNTSSGLQLATESAGIEHSLHNTRPHLLDISGIILENQLQIHWLYSTNVHEHGTIESLALEFVQTLRSLIAHCLAPESGGYTPTDFELLNISQQKLDQVLASVASKLELGKSKWQNLEDIYPLSPMQQGMLFHSLYAPSTSVYREQLSCTLRGKLKIQAFEAAWQQVVARHSILRTAFVWSNLEQPLQVVYRQLKVSVETHDWQELSVEEQQQQLEVFLHSQRQQSFQLSQAPLMRLNLIQLDEDCYEFVWSFHHILLDGWSLPLVFKDLLYFYQAFSQGENLPEQPTLSYRNYIAWLHKQDLAKAKEFWRQKLKGLIAPTPLTVDRSLSNREQLQVSYSEQQIQLTVQATTDVQSFARQHQLSVNNLVQATWALLLSRYSGETDVVFGATVSGREPSVVGIESMVGLFINTLPVRVQVSVETELLSLLKDLQAQQVECEEYSYSPLVEIQGVSEIPKGTSLFESILVFENYPVDAVVQQHNSSLEFSNIRSIEQTNYPLTVVASVSGQQLSVKMSYDTHRFADATITRMLGHFQILLEGIVDNPQKPISQLPLLSQVEQHQLLVLWNQTSVEYPQDKCIHHLFEEQALFTPEAVAVVYENQQLTYDELNRRANQLAHYLRSLGVGREVLVGICVERSVEMVVGLLGILKAGGAYVPLDPTYPTERKRFMLEDAAVSVLLTQQLLVDTLPEHRAQLVCLDTDWWLICQSQQNNPVTDVQAHNLAYVIYTSGSTGRPKGVEVAHTGLLNLVFWHQRTFEITSLDKATQLAGTAFDAAVWELWPYLTAGASVHLVTSEILYSSLHLRDWLISNQITLSFLPTPIAENLLSLEWNQCLALRGMLTGGDLLHHYPSALIPFPVVNNYGPSENTVVTTSGLVVSNGQQSLSSPTIGRPIANTQVYILDSHLQPVPIGVPGELHIGGAGLARGYLNRPELTMEKFIPNPFSLELGARLYKTGDLARYLPDGNIEYIGRSDHQVKLRGFRIELGEIEALLSQHPSVHSVVVTSRVEETTGTQRLVAYIVPQLATSPTVSEFRQFLKTKLPEYMVPSAIVIMESLPLTPNGKVDRRALPVPELQSNLDLYVAPRTPIEEMLTQIWASVLKVELVGIHDNFFSLGGHSLLATQLISRIRSSLKVELPLHSVFADATVAQMAQHIQHWQLQKLELTLPPIQATPRNVELPLSFAQSRLWFLDQLKPNSAFYNIPVALRLTGQLQLTALEQSLQEIIARHEALRTNFITVDGQPTQVIHTETDWTLSIVDWLELPTREREIAVQELASTQAQLPFSLANEPLFRATLVVINQSEHLMLVCMHHIVSDGWSMGVFVAELAALYNAFSQHQPSPLEPLKVQYADFAVWQRQWLTGDVLQAQLAYWQTQLANAPALLSLPTDRPRPRVQTEHGAHQPFALSVELTQALTQLSQLTGVTLFMTLLAAFDVLLYKYTGTEDILVGSPIANRNLSEVEGLIGFFVNTLVMRTDLSGNPTFSELLARVRDMTLDAYAHQDLSFEMLVEALQPERSLSQTPLFQVMFVLQNAPMSLVELAGLSVSSLPAQSTTAKFDLTLSMENTEAGLVGVWEYNTDLFESDTIERMAGHFQTLLSGIVANPVQPISQLPLLSEVEQQQLLVLWNQTSVEYPQDKCIHHLFEEQALFTPEAVAVVYENQQLTYDELNRRANQLAHYLRSLGVGREVLVGICVERSVEMVVGLLGILKAGGAYVPLDPTYPTERKRFMLEDAAVSVLLTQQLLVDTLPEHRAQLVCLDEVWEKITQNYQDNPLTGVRTFDLANVIYTSGSTGTPKGVMVTHSGLCNLAQAQIQTFNLHPESHILQFASLSFDASISEVMMALGSGATLYLGTQDSLMPGMPLIQRLRDYAITHVTLPPSALSVLPVEKLPTLQTIIVAGEASSVELIRLWSAGRNFFNAYGPTEATVCATVAKCTDGDLKARIGRPIANTQVYILDSHLQPVPIGVPGEIHIGGAGLARGYLNRPELTMEKFIPNPFSLELGARLYKTGDLARYLPSGNIEYLGRIDNQVKLRGFRIELGEIEALLSQHPSVHSVVVTSRVEEGTQRLVAYIVPQLATSPTVSEFRQFLKTKLPDYMVPSAFVILESLPLTPNGKVDRRALPVPNTNNFTMQTSFVPPLDIVELKLAEIWAEVLKVYPVGVKDNFFDLGGHSLLAVQLMARIEQQFKKNLPLATLFQNSTIEQLATILRQPINALNWSPIVPIQPNGSKRPFFCVPGAGGNTIYLYNLAHHLSKEQPFYGLQSLGLDGESKPHTRIEDMAASYIEAIQSIQPSGPYLLGGHSSGGMVAFEMATQLHKQGYEVALLALLDSYGPNYRTNELNFDCLDDLGWLNMIASQVESIYAKSLNVSSEALLVLTPDEQLNYFKEQLQMVNLLPPDVGIKQLRGFMQVFKTNHQISSVYMPQAVYPAQMTLFRAIEIDAVNNANSETVDELGLGWDKFSAQPLDLHLVPGDHNTMLSEPHVQVLAQQLTICIEGSQIDD